MQLQFSARSDLNDQWVFTIGGIRNARITTGFSRRVSRPLPGTGRRTSSRATVFCVRRSRARSSPFLNAGFLRTVWRVCVARGVVMTSLWPFPAGLVWSVQAARPGFHFCSVKRSGKLCIRLRVRGADADHRLHQRFT